MNLYNTRRLNESFNMPACDFCFWSSYTLLFISIETTFLAFLVEWEENLARVMHIFVRLDVSRKIINIDSNIGDVICICYHGDALQYFGLEF